MKVDIIGICEIKWTGNGKICENKKTLIYSEGTGDEH